MSTDERQRQILHGEKAVKVEIELPEKWVMGVDSYAKNHGLSILDCYKRKLFDAAEAAHFNRIPWSGGTAYRAHDGYEHVEMVEGKIKRKLNGDCFLSDTCEWLLAEYLSGNLVEKNEIEPMLMHIKKRCLETADLLDEKLKGF